MTTLMAFLVRDIPDSSSAKPACMKNTRAAAVASQTMLMSSAVMVSAKASEGLSKSRPANVRFLFMGNVL